MELILGIPTKRVTSKKEEQFNKAVLTLNQDLGKGTNKKFILSAKAIENLGLKDVEQACVSFSFIEDNKVLLVNSTKLNLPECLPVTKSRTFAHKKTYDYIAGIFELDTTSNNNFELVTTEHTFNNYPVFQLIPFIDENTEALKEDMDEEVKELLNTFSKQNVNEVKDKVEDENLIDGPKEELSILPRELDEDLI